MKVKVRSFPDGKIRREITLKDNATVLELLKRLDLRPDSWIVVRNDKAIPEDAPLKDGDSLRLLSVISGG
ncbi:MAG: MoaD/ThiS family protein [Thermoplasmata archaeon]